MEIAAVNTMAKSEAADNSPCYQGIVEALNGAVYVSSSEFQIEYMNDLMKERVEKRIDNISAGNGYGSLCYWVIYGRDLKCPWCMKEDVQRGNKSRATMQDPVDGRWYHVVGTPLNRPHGSISTQTVLLDITEEMRIESTFGCVVERSKIGFYIVKDGKFIYANKSLAQIFGYTVEELMSLPHSGLTAENPQNSLQVSGETGTFKGIRKDGTSVLVEYSESESLMGNNLVSIGTLREINNRRKSDRHEWKLRQSEKMEVLGALASGVAHDFNNILGSIMGFAELALKEQEAENRLKVYLNRVIESSDRARCLVRQILNYTYNSEQKRSPTAITPIIKETLNMLRSSLPSTIEIKQRIKTTQGRDLVDLDPTHICQVVINLCTNAAHAMRSAGGVLTVELSDILDSEIPDNLQTNALKPGMGASYLELTVSDTGHGIDKTVIDRIFDPYFTTKKQGEGNGIGLSIVQGIVKNYGGAIAVDSNLGTGTSFHVYLPWLPSRNSIAVDNCNKTKLGSVNRSGNGRERILFVDDEINLSLLGKEALESEGYKVLTMSDGISALNIFRSQPDSYDLVITDQTMPGMTGIELAREIQNIRKDIPIIMCTGFGKNIQSLAKKAGVWSLITKPYNIGDLEREIRDVMNKKISTETG